MRFVLILAVFVAVTASAVENVKADFPTRPVQRVWFYNRPANGNLDLLAKYFDYFILHKTEGATRDELTQRGVTAPFLAYVVMNQIHDPGSATVVPRQGNVAWFTGDFQRLSREHPDWFLLDSKGRRVKKLEEGKYTHYFMDIGNPGFRDFWLERVITALQDHGWNGVFIDNADASLVRYQKIDQVPAKYPTDENFQVAVKSFLSFINVRLRAKGLLAFANITGLKDPNVWFDYLESLDGAMQESFVVDWDTGYRSDSQWEEHLSRMERSQAEGKRVICVAQGKENNKERQEFAYASYLLIASGKASFRYASGCCYMYPWIYDNYAIDLGAPLGPRTFRDGVWQRSFSNGRVTVNLSEHKGQILVGNKQTAP